jgi:hypothetical protein
MKKLIVFLPLLLFAGSVKISVIVAQTTFGPQQVIIEPEVRNVQAVYAADLDNDDDTDVLSASYNDKITWYENDGSGNLGAKQIITSDVWYAESVYAADLDNDGDMDVLSASFGDGKIAWYENLLGSVGVEDIQTKPRLFSLYPNPSGSSTYIQIEPSAIQGQTLELRIVNAQGELVLANADVTASPQA